MKWIVDDLVPSEPVEFEYRLWPKAEHIRCECGGIIGMYDNSHFSCEKCNKTFERYQLNHELVMVNEKTGWIFPMRVREIEVRK